MKEIKFRVWNQTEKKMFSPFSLYEYVEGSNKFLNEETKEGNLLFPIDTLFLEFIGLGDKNGKEIYEGDILKTIFCKSIARNDIWYERYVVICREISHWGYRFEAETIKDIKRKKDKQLLKDFDDFSEFVVVGNIYENPELLFKEGKK